MQQAGRSRPNSTLASRSVITSSCVLTRICILSIQENSCSGRAAISNSGDACIRASRHPGAGAVRVLLSQSGRSESRGANSCGQVVSRLARVEGRVCVGQASSSLTAATATTHMLLRRTHSRVIMPVAVIGDRAPKRQGQRRMAVLARRPDQSISGRDKCDCESERASARR
jgi:hypothetical protein